MSSPARLVQLVLDIVSAAGRCLSNCVSSGSLWGVSLHLRSCVHPHAAADGWVDGWTGDTATGLHVFVDTKAVAFRTGHCLQPAAGPLVYAHGLTAFASRCL